MTATADTLNVERKSETRPWGSWQVIDVSRGYKVKRITVRPHARLSLQTHRHRSEHWVVVAGVATCTVGGRRLVAREGERVDVPRGCAHRIANEGDDELIIIEVQLGEYTGEDDIVRLEDDYGR
jgi:mannose-6-phosphate isomerase